MKNLRRNVVRALILGLGFLGIVFYATREPGVSVGFPFAYSRPVSTCPMVNSFVGCGYYYDPSLVVLDYAFWVVVAFLLVFTVDSFWARKNASLPRLISPSTLPAVEDLRIHEAPGYTTTDSGP
jgi:hypothetical protein